MVRSIVNQSLLLQKEATLGTPVITAMKRYHGIKGTVGWDTQEETFRAAGSSVDTGDNVLTELGSGNFEVMQDYNSMLPLLAGHFGAPVTTALEATPTPAYQHVFTIDPFAAPSITSFTGMWGEAGQQALQVAAMVFHQLTIGVQRTQLSLSTGAILRAPVTGVAMPTGAAVTDVPFVPVRAQTYCVYMDDTLATLGTTQLLALYSTEVNFGERLEPDWVVNCNLDSYNALLEREDVTRTQSLQVGFDASSVGMINDWRDGKLKYVRVESTGPDINGTDSYGLTIDTAVRLKPTDVGKSSTSSATVVNFDGSLRVGEDNFVAEITLVNGLSGL